MRRAPYVLGTTAVGLVAVLGFRTHALTLATVTPSALQGRAARASSDSSSSSSATSATGAPGASSGSAGSASTTGSGATATTVPTTTPSPATTSLSGTVTGAAEQTPYGVVQVRVTVSAGRITAVTAVELSANDIHSQEINAQAAPLLRRQALSVQSAQIDGVSGATFTSQGYQASLQSALDKLGYTG